MNINRYNYEEFFLLYVDNELGAEERRQVEVFVQENPDLEEELMMLKQSQLKPDTSLAIEDKSSLFKSEKHGMINLENYETFFLLYVDEELIAEERRAVELFASQHPAQQQELEILLQARITPDTSVVFPNKQDLYRRAGSERVIAFKVWRIVAVAAMLILALGIFWLNSGSETKPDIAKGEQTKKHINNTGQVAQNSPESSNGTTSKGQVSKDENENAGIAQVENRITKRDSKNLSGHIKDETHQVSVDQSPPPSVESPDVRGARLIAKADAPRVEPKGSASVENNVLIIDQPYEQAKPNESIALTRAETEPDELAIGPVQTKNKFRGLFRRVTRVVEKTTHIPTGENKRLLIGNLEIALK